MLANSLTLDEEDAVQAELLQLQAEAVSRRPSAAQMSLSLIASRYLDAKGAAERRDGAEPTVRTGPRACFACFGGHGRAGRGGKAKSGPRGLILRIVSLSHTCIILRAIRTSSRLHKAVHAQYVR